ncbi:MAG: outer membrane beta-barrel protein [Crocinitomicaceae bacterium]
MKKLILFTLAMTTGIVYSQDASDKKVQAGLGFSTGLNLNKTATKKMSTDGIGSAFSIGLNLNYNFSSTIGFFTGLDVDFEKNKIKPNPGTIGNGSTYYNYNDTKIIQKGDAQATDQLFMLSDRTQKPIYVTIPTMLLFRTKYFGDLRFFGKFGLRTSILVGGKINDNGFTLANNDINSIAAPAENNTMKVSSDMNFIRSSIGLSLGTEWNFSGSTSLAIEIGYYYGFVPIYRSNTIGEGKNKTLYYRDASGFREYYTNAMTQSQLQLKVALLF